jgi:hypothetical protein
MAKVTYTFWQHYSKESEEMDSMVEALRRAEYDADYNNASPESITTASGKVLDEHEMDTYWKKHKELARQGQKQEMNRLFSLRFVSDRPIHWRETSAIIRHMRWKPSISVSRGIAYLVANKWGKEQRIASVKQLRTMTPVQFWQRLRNIDPYRVAEVERGTF